MNVKNEELSPELKARETEVIQEVGVELSVFLAKFHSLSEPLQRGCAVFVFDVVNSIQEKIEEIDEMNSSADYTIEWLNKAEEEISYALFNAWRNIEKVKERLPEDI